MCKSGGFHLTKFISSNKKLLLLVPENQRGMGVKDQDLSGDLPNEKHWEFVGIYEKTFSAVVKVLSFIYFSCIS